MKKSTLLLAVLGTVAGAASAQSSVTMFGVVDLSLRYVNNDASTYQLAQDGMAASRLGFRGVEDLGGGLKASFWLEGALGPDTGRGGASFGNGTSAAQPKNAFLFTRRSTVSLSNQWGEIRLGRDYTPTFWNIGVFDPFGVQGVGSSGNIFLSAEIRSIAGAGAAYGTLVRANNAVQYILPNGIFGPGLYGQVMVAAGEAAPANKYFGGRIGYAAGPFDVAAAYGNTDVDVAGNVKLDNWNVGGSWNFGLLKLSGFYGSMDIERPGRRRCQAGQLVRRRQRAHWPVERQGQLRPGQTRRHRSMATRPTSSPSARTTTCPSARRSTPPTARSRTPTPPTACRPPDRR